MGAAVERGALARRISQTVRARWPLAIVLTILLILGMPPIAAVVLTSLQEGVLTAGAAWSLGNYRTVLGEFTQAGPVLNSLIFAFSSAIGALLLGGGLAVITERTDAPLAKLGYATAILVVAIPAPVYAFAWALLCGRLGPFNFLIGWANQTLGSDIPPLQITNLAGMIFVEALNYSALAFFLLAGPVRSIDRSLEEAAFMSGARPWQVVLRVTGPVMLPGILAILLLTFIRAMESFAVPALIGAPGRVSVITTEIFYAVTQSQPPRYGLAAAHGVTLVAVVVGLLLVYTAITSQAARFATITGKGFRARRIKLGRMRYILSAVLLLYFLVLVLLPLCILLFASLQNFYGGMRLGTFTLKQYSTLLESRGIGDAFVNSFIVGILAATAIMTLTFFAAWIGKHSSRRTVRMLDLAVSLPLAVPGTVLGLALLQILARLPIPLYGTLGAFVIVAVIRFMPYGFRYCQTGLLQVHSELEEAGLMSGATPLQVAMRIVLPLLAMPLIAGFIYVFLLAGRELEATALLATSNVPLIAPVLLDLYQNGYTPQLAAFSTVLIFIYGFCAYIFYLISRKHGFGFR